MTRNQRILLALIAAARMMLHPASSSAAECRADAIGTPCASDAECRAIAAPADACVFTPGTGGFTCQIPCEQAVAGADSGSNWAACPFGSLCAETTDRRGGGRSACRPVNFAVDLNLVDTCIRHWVTDAQPTGLDDAEACSDAVKMGRLLDRDQDGEFTLFDVDLCVHDYVDTPVCDRDTRRCDDGQLFCEKDADCGLTPGNPGAGAHCNTELGRCERQCGLIGINAETDDLAEVLERPCASPGKLCDYGRGQCVDVELDGFACEVDAQCPTGTYCALGECVERCYRNHDCPGSEWFCSHKNQCEPRPNPGATESREPRNYAIQFSKSDLNLDTLNTSRNVPLVILNRETKRQVLSDPNLVFGYRLELTDYRKLSPECGGDPSRLTAEEFSTCHMGAEREFVTLASPFGTITGGDERLGVTVGLNAGAVRGLAPGQYSTRLTALFSNGDRTQATIFFEKPGPSGSYSGRLSVYLSDPQVDLLANEPLDADLYMYPEGDSDSYIEWDTLLADQDIVQSKLFKDITRGLKVAGWIDGSSSTLFSLPRAKSREENRVPVVGIYSPQLGRMRLVAAIDIGANECWGETNGAFRACNPFGRKLRRLLEFLGPFDPTTRKFHGLYRETIWGLIPDASIAGGGSAVTLQGGFILSQVGQDSRTVEYAKNLLAAAGTPVEYPARSPVAEMPTDCQQYAAFRSAEGFEDYVTGLPATRLFTEAVNFSKQLGDARARSSSSAALSLSDFLRDQLRPCGEESAGTDGAAGCIRLPEARCGFLGLRRGLLEGWLHASDAGRELGPNQDAGLFCDRMPRTDRNSEDESVSVCPTGAVAPTVAGLQDFLRFYEYVTEALTFEATAERTDGAYALYRAATSGRPFEEGSAYDYKAARVAGALAAYDELQATVLSPETSHVLWHFPVAEFSQAGRPLLKQLRNAATERADTLMELLSLRRRVLETGGKGLFVTAHHAVQMQYLTEVFLALLQRHWEGSGFAYDGESARLLAKANTLVRRVDSSRNPLGLHPNRVYFFEGASTESGGQSPDPRANWHHFRDRLRGLLGGLEEDMSGVLTAMRESVRSTDDLESRLTVEQRQLEAIIEDACGTAEEQPGECLLSDAEREAALACKGDGCLYESACGSDDCTQVISVFKDRANDAVCHGSSKPVLIGDQGQERTCMRGRVGELLLERMGLDLQRRQILNRLGSVSRRTEQELRFLSDIDSENGEWRAFLQRQRASNATLSRLSNQMERAWATAQSAAEAASCVMLTGTATGGNCAKAAVATGIRSGAISAKSRVQEEIAEISATLDYQREILLANQANTKEVRAVRRNLDNLLTQAQNLGLEYQTVLQQLTNVAVRIDDQVKRVEGAQARYDEDIENILDHLVGYESGHRAIANRLVLDYERKYEAALLEAYKMVQAFVHRYNIQNEGRALRTLAFRAVSLEDLRSLASELDERAAVYCGESELDCDTIGEQRVLEFSLQRQLFPGLRTIVDPDTGSERSVGAQFHDLLLQSFLVRRQSKNLSIDTRFEIPFSVWLNDRGTAGGAPTRFVDGIAEEECNHVLSGGRGSGGSQVATVAVNVLTSQGNSAGGFKVRLARGSTDYIRSCSELRAPGEPLLYRYEVGSRKADNGAQEKFETDSVDFTACKDEDGLTDADSRNEITRCYHNFARDRSLGSTDWKLIVPDLDGAQSWILDGETKIHDLRVYFRYTARPLSGDARVVAGQAQ